MANQIPIKVMCDGSGNTCGLAQFTSSDSVAIAAGGTGLTSQGICEFVQPGLYAVGCQVTYLGICAGKADTGVGHDNTYAGHSAGTAVTTGCQHTIIGSQAGKAITTCSATVAIGYSAGCGLTFGVHNTLIGTAAGAAMTTKNNNTMIGYHAAAATNAGENVAVGACAMIANTVGVDNVAVGFQAGAAQVTAGCNNVFVGSLAGAVSLCRENVSIGAFAGKAATTGGGNVMIGACVGYGVVGGASNVYIGDKAGLANTSGNANVFIGNCAGCATTGSCCLIIGNGACDLITGDFSGGTFSVAGNVTIFDDANNADTSLSIGTGAAEALVVEALNGAANKTLEELRFTTKTASGTADHGKMSFYVDEAEIATIDDGGIDLASGLSFTIAGTAVTTSPGGSDTQIQYNNSGAFGGSSNLVWTNSSSTLDVSGTANAKELNVAAIAASLASQNASKIILVDLTDPTILWDVQAFLTQARYTSWYQELGAPPMRGAIWINNAKRDIVWWNLDTDASYMTFTAAANSVVGAVNTNDLAFLDGKLYFAQSSGTRLGIVDFLQDNIKTYDESQVSLYSGNIEERNDANGFLAYNTDASQRLLSATVNGVAASRDPDSLVDEFDRPIHWWSVGTAAGACIYNPYDDAIYDWSDSSRESTVQFLMNDKWLFTRDQTSYTGVNFIQMSAVDGDQPSTVQHFNPWNSADNSNTGTGSFPWTVAATISDISGNADATRVVVSSDEGVCLITLPNKFKSNSAYGWNWITASYQTPYMKGARFAAYPLNDVNDRSGAGNTLTNNNTATFTSGIFGSIATFDGVDQYLDKTSGVTEVSLKSAMFWAKSTSTTNPSGSSQYVLRFRKASNGAGLWFAYDTSGRMVMSASTDGIGSANPTTTPDTYDAKWHHYAFTWASDGNWHSYIDGVEVASTSGANGGAPADTIAIGAGFGSNYFAGQMAMVVGTAEPLTSDEINLEYQRGIRSLGGSTATLANVDVTSASVDPNTGLVAFTTAANQTEIWDIETGMRESIDATTTATIADADVRLKSGAILPEYITGRSGAIEFDGQERNVLG